MPDVGFEAVTLVFK